MSPAAAFPRSSSGRVRQIFLCPLPALHGYVLNRRLSTFCLLFSDGKEVLYKRSGLDPAAAQYMHQALQLAHSHGSFLSALLGLELEADALAKAQQSRCGHGHGAGDAAAPAVEGRSARPRQPYLDCGSVWRAASQT